MEKYTNRLYELLYSPIVTPYNLLENAKLDNYSYVKYYTGERGLVAEMKCVTKYNIEAIFYYFFNENDHLYKIERDMCNEKEIMFEREEELERVKNEYINSKKIEKQAI